MNQIFHAKGAKDLKGKVFVFLLLIPLRLGVRLLIHDA